MSAITPMEVKQHYEQHIPTWVIDVFNAEIKKQLSGQRALVRQPEIVLLLIAAAPKELVDTLTANQLREKLFAEKWLDVEVYFRKAGWKVEYYKPHYSDSDDPTWTFTVPAVGANAVPAGIVASYCSPAQVELIGQLHKDFLGRMSNGGIPYDVCARFSQAFNAIVTDLQKNQ